MDWRQDARSEAWQSAYGSDPEFKPRYRVPNRRFFWQLWKPRWRWVEGISRAQLARAYGIDPQTIWCWQSDEPTINLNKMLGFDLLGF